MPAGRRRLSHPVLHAAQACMPMRRNVTACGESAPFSRTAARCLDPYEMAADYAQSPDDVLRLHDRARSDSLRSQPEEYRVPIIVADTWVVSGNGLGIQVDASSVTKKPDVYTVSIYYQNDAEYVPLVNYPIFHKIERPTVYD